MVWTRIRNDGNRWPKRIMTWSPGGRRRRRRPEVKWEKEVERVMKQRNVISDDAVNWLPWLLNTSKQRTTGKPVTYIHRIWVKKVCGHWGTVFLFPAGARDYYVLPPNPQTDSAIHPAPRNAFPGGKAAGAWSWPLPSGKDECSYLFTASCAFTTCPAIVLSYKNGLCISSDCYIPALQLFVEYFFRLGSFQMIWHCVPEFMALARPCMVRSHLKDFSPRNWDTTVVFLKESCSVSVVLLAWQLACVAPVSSTVHMARLASLLQLLCLQVEHLALEGERSHWFLRSFCSWQ